jgi:uncharacterized membrane protein
MKNKKGFIVFGVIVIVFCFIVLVGIFSNSNIAIESYDAIIEVDEAGNMTVDETWVIRYPEGYNVRFRDLKYGKNHRNNPLMSGLNYQNDQSALDLNTIKARVSYIDGDDIIDITDKIGIGYSYLGDRDELGEPIECYPYSSECESVFVNLQAVGGMKEKMVFEYTYTINGAVTGYDDISELNWVLFAGVEATVKKAQVKINLYNNTNLDALRVWGHGLSQGNIDITSLKEINISARNIKTTEELEFRILMDNTTVANIANDNVIVGAMQEKIINYESKLARETNIKNIIAKTINLLTIILVIVMVYITYKVYKKYDKEYVPEFSGVYYRELPYDYTPAEMSYLYYFGKTNDEDVTATLLDLVRKGYLELEVTPSVTNRKRNDMTIHLKQDKPLTKLLPHEEHIIQWFIKDIGDGSKVTIDQIEKYGKKSYAEATKFTNRGSQFKRKVKTEAEKHDFFENAAEKAKNKAQIYVLLPIAFAIICLLIVPMLDVDASVNGFISLAIMVAYLVYLYSIKRRSKEGNEQFAKWKAFKRFLEEFSMMKDYPMPSVVVWEHYLVYATSLKIADKVMAQLRVKLPEMDTEEGTFLSNRYVYPGFYYGYMVNRINRSVSIAKNNVVSTIARHNTSSGSGHGGGFSGGSSFGGGGGGARSR